MSLRKFLKYERPYLILLGSAVGVVTAVLYAEPGHQRSWTGAAYAVSLTFLLALAFFVHRYLKLAQGLHRLHAEDHETLTLEGEAFRHEMERMEQEHIRALNEVQARQREHDDYIASWFHEIKIPISVIRLMQQTEVDAKSLDEEVSRIEHYVDQALYYAKLDSFHQDYAIANCELEPLVKNVVKHNAKSFISRKIKLTLELEAATVQSDAKWLQFIVNQLVTNSLKYTNERGEIRIASRTLPDEKQLLVRDNGAGIDPRDLPRIFNRGFTGAFGRTHAKSTGMGLYLAQELSGKLGHYITCTSEPGRFTEMVIHFPKNSDPYPDLLTRRGTQTQ